MKPNYKLALIISITVLQVILTSNVAAQNTGCTTCDNKHGASNCNCVDDMVEKSTGYCGYVVQYDPCGNCFQIYKHNCNLIRCIRNFNKKIAGADYRKVRQVAAGAPVQFYVNNLNFFKYKLNVESGSIEVSSGDPGLFKAFQDVLSKLSNVSSLLENPCTETRDYFEKRNVLIGKSTDVALLTKLSSKVTEEDCLTIDTSDLGKIVRSEKKWERSTYYELLTNFKEEWETDYEAYKAVVNQISLNKKCEDFFKEKVKDTVVLSKLNSRILKLLKDLEYPNPEYQYNVPQVKNVDYLTFKINLNGKDEALNNKLHMVNEEIYVPVRGGFRMDFSTGILFNSFRTEKFGFRDSLQYTDTSIINHGKKIYSEGVENRNFGISTLLHIYPRQMARFSFAPAIGLGITTNIDYSLLLGGSLIIGRLQKASISVGYSLNSIKVLSPKNLINNTFVPTDYEPKTIRKFTEGWFISLGYTFGAPSKSANVQKAAESDDKEEEKK